MLATEVIKKKRQGQELHSEEIQFFINGYTKGEIPDYQMSSLLMAIFLNGMSEKETIELTQTMLDSGDRVAFSSLFAVDKHSTGGVGDKTSLILAPLVAACGVPVPMMSGRGLGHTGGTLDKLESIPGFNVFLDLKSFKQQTEKHSLCFIGQTKNICPADKKIYALRDVTATVESLPLICASIMSKKIAEGIKGLVLDVKFGSGAFMKTLDDAKALAKGLISIGRGHNIKTQALLTNMNQPLGRFVGNSLEVGECLAILKNENFFGNDVAQFDDTKELSIELASHMVALAKNQSLEASRDEVTSALKSGEAFSKFEEVCKIQGGDLTQIPYPDQKTSLVVNKNGFFESVDSEKVGLAGIELGAGRRKVTDIIDPSNGIEIHKKIGEPISKGDVLFTIHHNKDSKGVDAARKVLQSSYIIGDSPSAAQPLIADFL